MWTSRTPPKFTLIWGIFYMFKDDKKHSLVACFSLFLWNYHSLTGFIQVTKLHSQSYWTNVWNSDIDKLIEFAECLCLYEMTGKREGWQIYKETNQKLWNTKYKTDFQLHWWLFSLSVLLEVKCFIGISQGNHLYAQTECYQGQTTKTEAAKLQRKMSFVEWYDYSRYTYCFNHR